MLESLSVQRGAAVTATPTLRPLIVVSAIALAALIAGVVLAGRVLLESFNQIELATAQQRAALQLDIFKTDLEQLTSSNRDYAHLDATEAFVQGGRRNLVDESLSAESLLGLRVDVFVIVDRNGTVLHSGLVDRQTRTLTAPAPDAILSPFLRVARGAGTLANVPVAQHVIDTAEGLAGVSALEIRRSDHSRPSGAHLLFGRYIRLQELQRMRQPGQMTVDLLPLRATGNARPTLPAAVRNWAQSAGAPSTRVDSDGGAAVSYSLIRAVDGQPVALLKTMNTRDISARGQRMTWTLLGSIGALALIFGATLFWLVLRLHRSFKARETAEQRYRNIAAQLGETVVLIDAEDHHIVEVNKAVLEGLGYTQELVSGLQVSQLFPDLDLEALSRADEQSRTTCQSRVRRKDGTHTDAEITVTQLTEGTRRLLCLIGHDISHRKVVEEQQRANHRKLLHIAQHDPLTRLPNRLYLRSRFPRVIAKAAVAEHSIALIYLDIDHFKNINDSRGHAHGDRLLQIVAQRLRHTIGAQDAVVRMGGDEFVVVASLFSDPSSIESLAQRLQTAVSAPLSIDGQHLAVTASMGVALYPRDGLDLEMLLKHADIALYQAKESGRACHRFFAPDMNLKVSEDVALEQALRHAIGTKQFHMDFQPVVDLKTSRVTSVEALMRWQHPEMGLVPPGRFIPVAERSGLILALGQFAIEQVLRQMRAWLDAGVNCVPVAINVAPQQLERTDFVALVTELTTKSGIEPRWLRFEITESALLQNTDKLVGTLQQLRQLGVQILIDDFGTGYSGLSYLTQLPVDTIKIDRSFVVDPAHNGGDSPIITAILDMARKLGLVTIAEGVETREQALRLRRQGCDFAQGYFFSKPLSPRRCRRLLEKLRLRDQQRERPKLAVAS